MPKKVPLSPVQMAHDSAVRNMRAAIYRKSEAETLTALLDILLETAKICHEAEPEYFTYFDLTERYGLSRKTVETFKLPEHRFGGSIRFARDAVLEWEAENLHSFGNVAP